MVLILDVARFKYPPHWVPLSLLWEAMKSIDEATGHPRGYMIMSRLGKAPSILYTVNCRNKSWNVVAKYLVEDVPRLLKSEDVKDIHKLLSVVYKSAPSDIREFIKWIAEVRTQEDDSFSISEEEKARVAIKEQVLKELQTTKLHKHVIGWLTSVVLCCKSNTLSGEEDTLPKIAAQVCSQGAEILGGKSGEIWRMETKVKHLKSDGEKAVTIVRAQQGVDMLVPSSSSSSPDVDCEGVHPSTGDVLTILLLALPEDTWSAIRQVQIGSLVSTDDLPPLLREEVLNLRRQLHFLTRDLCSST